MPTTQPIVSMDGRLASCDVTVIVVGVVLAAVLSHVLAVLVVVLVGALEAVPGTAHQLVAVDAQKHLLVVVVAESYVLGVAPHIVVAWPHEAAWVYPMAKFSVWYTNLEMGGQK